MSVNDNPRAVTDELFDVKSGDSSTNATFIFGNEDHTLGNALRHILIQKSETEFCGYSVPHPYEPKMNIRLQTRQFPAIKVLKDGLNDLSMTATCLETEFIRALDEYELIHSS
jgi:DNA-directed RNA polymerase I and III subunit RPAC2